MNYKASAVLSILILLIAGSAFAKPTGKVGPVLECTFAKVDGTYEARFGYNNTTGATQTIPVGDFNRLTPAKFNGSQPTVFEAGRAVNVLQIPFSKEDGNITWMVNGSSSTSSAGGGPRCRPQTPALNAMLNGNAQVDLTWNAVSDVTSYKIIVTDASGAETEYKDIRSTQWSHTALSCGMQYSYQIKSNGVEQDSHPSAAVTINTPACPPPAPLAPNFSAALVSPTEALLQWSAVEHAASYRVEQEQGSAWTTLATVADTSYRVAGLTCGTNANYRVVSMNISGEGASIPANVMTDACVINPVQLLTNGSFEQKITGWTLRNSTKDGVRCPAKPLASDGQCFYFAKGSGFEKSVLNQIIDVTGMGIDSSTPLTFTADLQTLRVQKGLNLMINAVYADGTWQQKRYWLPRNTVSYRTITRTFVPAKPVVRLNVVIRYKNPNASGVLRLDDVSLSYMPASVSAPTTQGMTQDVSLDGGVLPMPPAPQQ